MPGDGEDAIGLDQKPEGTGNPEAIARDIWPSNRVNVEVIRNRGGVPPGPWPHEVGKLKRQVGERPRIRVTTSLAYRLRAAVGHSLVLALSIPAPVLSCGQGFTGQRTVFETRRSVAQVPAD